MDESERWASFRHPTADAVSDWTDSYFSRTRAIVRRFGDAVQLDRSLDVLLELTDSQITYRQRYVMVAARAPAVDLVVLDPHNPRSIAYQLDRIEQHLHHLLGELLPRLPHRGERRVERGGETRVVEPDEGDVVRHSQPRPAQRAERPRGHEVGCGEDGVDVG